MSCWSSFEACGVCVCVRCSYGRGWKSYRRSFWMMCMLSRWRRCRISSNALANSSKPHCRLQSTSSKRARISFSRSGTHSLFKTCSLKQLQVQTWPTSFIFSWIKSRCWFISILHINSVNYSFCALIHPNHFIHVYILLNYSIIVCGIKIWPSPSCA